MPPTVTCQRLSVPALRHGSLTGRTSAPPRRGPIHDAPPAGTGMTDAGDGTAWIRGRPLQRFRDEPQPDVSMLPKCGPAVEAEAAPQKVCTFYAAGRVDRQAGPPDALIQPLASAWDASSPSASAAEGTKQRDRAVSHLAVVHICSRKLQFSRRYGLRCMETTKQQFRWHAGLRTDGTPDLTTCSRRLSRPLPAVVLCR